VLVTSAAKAAYDAAVPCVRPTGILLVVGLPADSLCFSPISMAGTEIRIQASAVGTRQDLREVLDMAAAGKVRCQVTSRPLADANAVLEDLRHGRIAGRVVLTPR
jgi:propanol-preferring alcohol dehydrogenase